MNCRLMLLLALAGIICCTSASPAITFENFNEEIDDDHEPNQELVLAEIINDVELQNDDPDDGQLGYAQQKNDVELQNDDPDDGQFGYAQQKVNKIDSGCLDRLYIMGFTSGHRHAGSNGRHSVQLEAHGLTRTVHLPNLPGKDYLRNKGDLWKIPISAFQFGTKCTKLSDIEEIAMDQNSNDGWQINSIATFVRDSKSGKFRTLSIDMDVNHWVDGNGKVRYRHFGLTLVK